MLQHGPDLAQRLSKLEAQLDRFSLTLQQWQQHKQLQPRAIADHWTAGDQPGVPHQHLQQFEDTLPHEFSAFREMHEESVNRLREPASNLEELGAASSRAVARLERTDPGLAALEGDLHLRLTELVRGLQAVVAELQAGATHPAPSMPGSAPAWPLDDVVRLHDDLRRSAHGRDDLPTGRDTDLASSRSAPRVEAALALAGRVESLADAVSSERQEVAKAIEQHERLRRNWSMAFAVLALGILGAGAFALGLQRRVDAKLNEAAARAVAAERQAETAAQLADQRVVATREDANRKISEAEQTARKAQTVSDVLAAPDLVRFNVTSASTTARAYAQMLWSRSRGVVISGSRVPPAPAGSTYQAWLLTSGEPISAGLFVPDAGGRFMLVTEDPPKVPRSVTGVAVTVEPVGGRSTPSGRTLLTRTP